MLAKILFSSEPVSLRLLSTIAYAILAVFAGLSSHRSNNISSAYILLSASLCLLHHIKSSVGSRSSITRTGSAFLSQIKSPSQMYRQYSQMPGSQIRFFFGLTFIFTSPHPFVVHGFLLVMDSCLSISRICANISRSPHVG